MRPSYIANSFPPKDGKTLAKWADQIEVEKSHSGSSMTDIAYITSLSKNLNRTAMIAFLELQLDGQAAVT